MKEVLEECGFIYYLILARLWDVDPKMYQKEGMRLAVGDRLQFASHKTAHPHLQQNSTTLVEHISYCALEWHQMAVRLVFGALKPLCDLFTVHTADYLHG